MIRRILFAAVLLLSACGGERTINGFSLACRTSWGMFDGIFCEAPLSGGMLLYYTEFSNEPTIHWGNKEIGHAGVIPQNSEATVRAVGFNEHYVVAEDTNGLLYLVEIKSPSDYPEVQGPFPVADFHSRFVSLALPELRDVPRPN